MIPHCVFERTLRGFLEPIAPFLDDPTVSEILVNGPNDVFIERSGQLVPTNATFDSVDALLGAMRVIAQYVGRPLDAHHPILEARLPDGSRVAALLSPIAAGGPALAIRRFSEDRLTLSKLVELGALTEAAAETLQVLVRAKRNLVVAGGTGSGKTSLLNALSAFIPNGERIIVMEDARELNLQQRHVVSLETRPPDAKGRGGITIRDLFRASLRMRPDRLVLGEIRGQEALELIQAMTSGHGGCLSTVHATYPVDTLHRLETMALMSAIELPLHALRSQVASAVDIVVQTARFQDGSRGLTHIAEVCGATREGYQLRNLFERRFDDPLPGERTVRAALVPTGHLPECLDALRAVGLDLPPAVYQAASAGGVDGEGGRDDR